MNPPRPGMLVLFIAMTALASPLRGAPERTAQNEPGPYVNVYHDDFVAFQVRRDRIKTLGDNLYMVWLRWLWAEPRPWKSGTETARIIVSELDCKNLRSRELAILHKDREGKIFDVEEMSPDESPWKQFAPETGAAATMGRLCEFVPELARTAKTKTTDEKKE